MRETLERATRYVVLSAARVGRSGSSGLQNNSRRLIEVSESWMALAGRFGKAGQEGWVDGVLVWVVASCAFPHLKYPVLFI